MINKTNIEWVKNPDGTQGYTWNPISGCLNHINGMCKGGNFPCYAYRLANGRLRERYLANKNTSPILLNGGEWIDEKIDHPFIDPFYPRFWEDRLDDPFLVDRNIGIKRHTGGQRRTPKGIFVCDMGELFGDWIPREWQEQIHLTITLNPQHRFYLLTKQPQNLAKFSPFPGNCYVGVTVTQKDKLIPALDALDSIQCSIRYLSIEPMLGAFDMPDLDILLGGTVNQVIIGAQTKPYKPPKIEWVSEIVEACDKAGVAVFLKGNLVPLFSGGIYDKKGKHTLIPMGELRQEIP